MDHAIEIDIFVCCDVGGAGGSWLRVLVRLGLQGPLFLTCINVNLIMQKYSHALLTVGLTYLSIKNKWEWKSKPIPQSTITVITYP